MSETTFLAAVLFLIFALIFGAIIQWAVSKVKAYKPPVSILWFVFGMVVCAIEIACVPNKVAGVKDGITSTSIVIDPQHPLGLLGIGIAEASRVHSSVLYYIVLPILLYDATQQISWYHFSKNLRVGLLLAIVGVCFQVALIGFLMQWTFNQVVNTSDGAASSGRGLGLLPVVDDSGIHFPFFEEWLPEHLLTTPLLPLHSELNETTKETLDPEFYKFDSDHFLSRRASEGVFLWRGPHVSPPAVRAQNVRAASRPSLSFSLMTASAVASTDPIAVISILEEMEAPPHFNSLFDSEALINDGSSIFLFTFFKSLTRGQSTTWQESISRFATLLLVGPAFGLVVAALMYRWLKHFQFFPYDETLAVVFMAYLVFFLAEIYLRTSGPLTIVVYGLYFKFFAKAAFEAKTLEVHHHFVRGVALAATSVVFIISGIASMRMIWDALTARANLELPEDMPEIEPESVGVGRILAGTEVDMASQLWRVPVFYLFLISARFIMIGLFFPIIRRLLGGFTWKEYILLSWGGLRGAVCLILGLLIEQDDHIDDTLSSTAALYIASSAFLVLFFNGLTFEFLYKLLKPYTANPFKQVYLKKVMKFIDREYFNEVALLQSHWLFDQTWALVYADRLVPRLGRTSMDSRGKIKLEMPKASRLLRELRPCELRKALPSKATRARNEEEFAGEEIPVLAPTVNVFADEPIIRRPEVIPRNKPETSEPGHATAAVLQKLRRAPDQRMDLGRNLEVLEMEEEEPAPDVISRQISKQQEDNLLAVTQAKSQELGRMVSGGSDGSGTGRVCFNLPAPSNSSHSMRSPSTLPIQPAAVITGARTSSPSAAPYDTTPFRRIPGYRVDFVSRIRSEPYGGALDAAAVDGMEQGMPMRRFSNSRIDASRKSLQTLEAPIEEADPAIAPPFEQLSTMNMSEWDTYFSSKQPPHIPRTMSVPNQIARTAMMMEGRQLAEIDENRTKVTHREREGEIQIMVVNTMRQLYKRMYDQNFISGTTFVGLQAIADVVSDFAILDVAKKSSLKAWKDVFELGENVYRAAGQEVDELEQTVQRSAQSRCGNWFQMKESRQCRMERLATVLGTSTGWDLEWRLIQRRLSQTSVKTEKIKNVLKCVSCRRVDGTAGDGDDTNIDVRAAAAEPVTVLAISQSTSAQQESPGRWRKLNRRLWTSLWSVIGPRQIFPALDDLQLLCAFVDVHDEMLMRGDQGLRYVLGSRLLPAFEAQIDKAREAVWDLQDSYPDSFPYAMISHAAIFLLNLKIQLVEEFFEKGLLLDEDKSKVCEFLKEQVVAVTKYHPPYLFT